MIMETDARTVLPSIHVPSLILHRVGDRNCDVRGARVAADQIPGARYVELSGDDHLPWVGDSEAIVGEIERFLTGIWREGGWEEPEPERVLSTVLFTDIVGSSERAASLGDRAWRQLLEKHHALVRSQLVHFRGREMDAAGDGFFASFDGPARAIRCANAIVDGMRELQLEVRAGLHTGECELMDDKISGLTVSIGARVAAKAGPSQVLISQTVKDLVAGSGLTFEDAGEHELKGVPDRWHLYRVVSGQA
jgi:class 3 adenylate cyclase